MIGVTGLDAERAWARELLALLGERGAALRELADLGALLGELLEQGRAAWPALPLPDAALIGKLAQVCSSVPGPEAPRVLRAVRADELYLACSCAEAIAGAAAALEQRYFGALVRACARVDRAPHFADEVLQQLRERLFLPRGDRPAGIALYNGLGPLAGWLRTSAQRIALNLRTRGPTPAEGGDERLLAAPGQADPEVEHFKAEYRPEFDRALRESLAQLSGRERLLLQLHYLEGLSTRQIARMEGLNQSSISRALAAARDQLRESTLRTLGARLSLTESQLASLAGLVMSRLSLGLAAP